MKFIWLTRGPNTYLAALLEALRRRGVDVEVCYFEGRYDGYRRRLGWRDPPLRPWEHYARSLREISKAVPDYRERCSLVAGFARWPEWRTCLLSVFTRRPWFVMSEGTRGRWFMRPVFRLFAWLAARDARAVFALGPFAGRQFAEAGVPSRKIVPFRYAVMPPPRQSEMERRGGCVFVFAGSFCDRKGFDVLAKAWRRLAAAFPDCRLLVVGGAVETLGAMSKPELDGFLSSDRVEFAGTLRQEDVYSVIMRGDVMLLPSRYDPWGVALVEGAAAGLAMIGSDQTGAAVDMIEEGVNGFVVEAGDEDSLHRAMARYAANPSLARTLGANARNAAQRATGEHLADVMIRALAGDADRKDGLVREVNGMMVVDALLRKNGLVAADEVWVHGMWTPDKWWACVRAKLAGKRLVRMTHGSLSPVYLERQGKWKKRLVKPIEMLCFALADRIVATGPWEVEWARSWGLKRPVDVIDLKRFFAFDLANVRAKRDELARRDAACPLHVLYLGRRHPLKGVDALEKAIADLNADAAANGSSRRAELREVSDHFGEALKADWTWADVLCQPTLSENFGLVVAEALERGLPAITTDGAPAWAGQEGVIWLEGYRREDLTVRSSLLKEAFARFQERGDRRV